MQYEITANVPGQWYILVKGNHNDPPVALFYDLDAAEAFIVSLGAGVQQQTMMDAARIEATCRGNPCSYGGGKIVSDEIDWQDIVARLNERIQQQALEYVSLFDQCSAHLARIAELEKERDALKADAERLNAIVNTPQSGDFLRAVSIEAEHQRQRWGSSHDAGKAPADWFWLVGYLGGKALHAHASGNIEKAEHHIITTAAACENWHKNMFGKTDMRPGIDGEAALQAEKEAR